MTKSVNSSGAKESVCQEADRIVSTERKFDYGHPLDNFTQTADLFSAILYKKLKEPITAEEVGLLMIAVKLSRQTNAAKRDNLVDIAGYAKATDLVFEERERRDAHRSVDS